jgi:hypothetical protein
MPNHVTNNLIVSGVSPERLTEILEKISGYQHYEPEYEGDKAEDKFRAIDFNKIIPMPESLNCISGSDGDTALLAVYGIGINRYFGTGQQEAKELLAKMDEKRKEDAIKLAEIYKHNYEEYGCTTWYEWCCENWGTKWNAYSTERNENEIRFKTAWATPCKIIKELSKQYPDATFSVSYADEDLGQNCGRYTLHNGELLEEWYPEGEESLRFACEITGYDYEEELQERAEYDEGFADENNLKNTLEDTGIASASKE